MIHYRVQAPYGADVIWLVIFVGFELACQGQGKGQ